MFDTVHARPGMPLAVVQTLLMRLPARAVALVVPTTAPTSECEALLLREGALETIACRAQREGKDVTIVGGSTALRARAVVAGLMAAATLDDWRAACRAREVDAPVRPVTPPVATGHPHLWLVTPTPGSTEAEDEPPDYLRGLLPDDAPTMPVIDLSGQTVDEMHDDTAEATNLRVTRQAERYEDVITWRILATAEHAARDAVNGTVHDGLREGGGASGTRLVCSPWTRPLSPTGDGADGVRFS